MIRVDIIDSCPIFAHGLEHILASNGFRVVGVRTVAAEERCWHADILLVDPDSIEQATLDEFVAAADPVAPVLLLGWSAEPELLVRYADSGAAGYIDRRDGVDDLLTAIRSVAEGGAFWVSPRSASMSSLDEAQPDSDSTVLSPRERQVLRLIARGLTHGQVARRLGISPHTVDTYVKRIRSKLDLGNKAQLTRAAMLGNYYSEEPPPAQVPIRIVPRQCDRASTTVITSQHPRTMVAAEAVGRLRSDP